MCLSVTLLRIKKTPEYTCPAHDNNSSVWALFRAGVKLTHVSPDKVYALLLIEKKKNTLSKLYKSMYMQKHKEVHHPQSDPWSLNAGRSKDFYLCTEFVFTISFLPAISLAIDPSFKKDQEILVLPLDLQKFDTHEKLAQDVLKHFGKVKRN